MACQIIIAGKPSLIYHLVINEYQTIQSIMSNSKLVKFLNNTKEPPTTEKKFTSVIFSDSKGNYLQNHVRSSHPVEREIVFWCKGGAKIKNRFNWLESVLQQKIAEL